MRAQLPVLESVDGLRDAALAIVMHHRPDVDPADVAARLDRLVDEVRERLRPNASARAVLAHAHAHLFDDLGFRGDVDDYHDPANSDLLAVLERRRGLPILLTLVYKLVLEGLGLRVHGVNAPGHFLARVESDEPGFVPMIIDPFGAGRVLSVPEALLLVVRVTGTARVTDLPLATHRDWVLRMLRNLVGSHHERGRDDDRRAMEELFQLVAAG